VIDALFDTPMAELLAKLPFSPDACAALAEHKGPKGALLDCVHALETGDLVAAEAILPTAIRLYTTALAWADDTAEILLGR
jgi:c-di-GMP-related signal transduction protein